MVIAIIGAGAAGCFCAIEVKRRMPQAEVVVYEAGTRALAKVAITGGGRCNLTNSFREVTDLRRVYPRGDKLMRRLLTRFSHRDCFDWWEREGVRLVTMDDECVFPRSQNAQEIVGTLLRLMQTTGVRLHTRHRVRQMEALPQGYRLSFDVHSVMADRVVVTTGGHPCQRGFAMLEGLQLAVVPPVPSLFTFNIEGDWRQELMGTVVEGAVVSLAGTKFRAEGPLLLTHWGMSGPAILKLSSHAARFLAEHDYQATLCVNWCAATETDVQQLLSATMQQSAAKQVTSAHPSCLTSCHWSVLLRKAGVPLTQRWGALNAKHVNRLVTTLTADTYRITGRCPFKDEFVTCGGVSLQSVEASTLESKHHPGL
ncbi:MAG: aminoacetone oxidase family FAD-binding enzyme, partial [Bacteroidaceae bacterium]|nr:aminoacetone oxidase family FAD-binding enzyme [Bacteroidaceae bacterium]